MAKIWTVSKALGTMPFDLADASVVYEKATTDAEGRKVEEGDDVRKGGVGQDLRLDYRWIDLRTTAHNAIMRISSGVCTLFREFLLSYVGRWRWGIRLLLAACCSCCPACLGLHDAWLRVFGHTARTSWRSRPPSCSRVPARVAQRCSLWTTSAAPRRWRSRRSCTSR